MEKRVRSYETALNEVCLPTWQLLLLLLFVCLFVCLSFVFCLYQEVTCTFIFIPSQLNVCFICLFVCLLSIPLGLLGEEEDAEGVGDEESS